MGGWQLVLASALSIAPLVLGYFTPVGAAEAPHAALGLSLLGWMVLIGLPGATCEGLLRSGARALAAAAPMLVLALRLDSARAGAELSAEDGLVALVSLAMLAALHVAARRASSASTWHGFSWVLFVALLPALGFVVSIFEVSGDGAGAWLSDWSPLGFGLRLVSSRAPALELSSLAPAAFTSVLLLVTAELDRRRGAAPRADASAA